MGVVTVARTPTAHQQRTLDHVQRMVRDILAHEDWSYRRLGQACEVAHGAVQGWEAGESLPNAAAFLRLQSIHRALPR